MRITRSTPRDGSVLPEAITAILALPDSALYHAQHKRRNPKSLYARSLLRVAASWHAVLDELESFEFSFLLTKNADRLTQVLDLHRDLLFALYEHLDASYGCVRALFPAKGDGDPLLDTQFLEKAKVPGWNDFRSRVRPYVTNRIGAVVNSLKHNQSELAYLYLHRDADVRPGYYVRDVQTSGALGPSLRVHADGNSGFSFARDMLLHFWNLYFISSELSVLLRRNSPPGTSSVLPAVEPSLCTSFERLAERVAAVPLAFFPDEVRQPCPMVRWNPKLRELELQMPSAIKPRRLPDSYQIVASMNIDMTHSTNKLPYFGANAA